MRRKTVSVNVGIVDIGSNHSIKTQSMTTASTLDTNASVEEAIRIIDAGGKLVRFTAPNTKEAENLENIKSAIRKKGCSLETSKLEILTEFCFIIYFTNIKKNYNKRELFKLAPIKEANIG